MGGNGAPLGIFHSVLPPPSCHPRRSVSMKESLRPIVRVNGRVRAISEERDFDPDFGWVTPPVISVWVW